MNNDKKLILAIKKINSAAEFEASDVDNIIWKNGTTPISKSDIEAQYATVEAEEENKTNKKASGKQKLKDLGLDDDEIQALMGA
jgi:predicted ATP-grasp superfamily ATP-dependent carboligase